MIQIRNLRVEFAKEFKKPTQRLLDFEKFWNWDGSMDKHQFIAKHGLSPSYYEFMWLRKGYK